MLKCDRFEEFMPVLHFMTRLARSAGKLIKEVKERSADHLVVPGAAPLPEACPPAATAWERMWEAVPVIKSEFFFSARTDAMGTRNARHHRNSPQKQLTE